MTTNLCPWHRKMGPTSESVEEEMQKAVFDTKITSTICLYKNTQTPFCQLLTEGLQGNDNKNRRISNLSLADINQQIFNLFQDSQVACCLTSGCYVAIRLLHRQISVIFDLKLNRALKPNVRLILVQTIRKSSSILLLLALKSASFLHSIIEDQVM